MGLALWELCPTAFVGGVEIDFETYVSYPRLGNILTLFLGNFFGPFTQPWVGLAFGTCASDLLLGEPP